MKLSNTYIGAAIVSGIVLYACSLDSAKTKTLWMPRLWVDPETHCQYFRVQNDVLIPRQGIPCGKPLPVGAE